VWPLVTHAQSPIPVVGFLHARSAEDVAYQIAAFRTGLAETGYIENKSVSIQYRFANESRHRLRVYEFVVSWLAK
jgi:putative tryptophan/tyrosine transport system substrate-binding protein